MSEVQQSPASVLVTRDRDVTSTNAQDFRHTIFAIMQQGGKDVVIDLQHVALVDSTGIGGVDCRAKRFRSARGLPQGHACVV